MVVPAELVQGKIFIGLLLNVMLFGINVTQTYIYYIYSKKDRLWIKITVAIIFVADFVQPMILSIYLYQTLIVNFGNETAISTANSLFAVVPTMTSLTACIVQIFFAWRIRILTNNWYYVGFIIAATVLGGASSIVVAYVARFSPQFNELRAFKLEVIFGFVSGMLGNIMITLVMGALSSTLDVNSKKHKTGFRQSKKMVHRILCFTVQTGLLTLIAASLNMIFYLISTDGTHLIFNFIVSKFYTISLLTSLNYRQGWGYDTSEDNDGEFDLSTDLRAGLRFASNSQSTDDQTSESVVVITPPEPKNEVKDNLNSGADLEASVTHHDCQQVHFKERP